MNGGRFLWKKCWQLCWQNLRGNEEWKGNILSVIAGSFNHRQLCWQQQWDAVSLADAAAEVRQEAEHSRQHKVLMRKTHQETCTCCMGSNQCLIKLGIAAYIYWLHGNKVLRAVKTVHNFCHSHRAICNDDSWLGPVVFWNLLLKSRCKDCQWRQNFYRFRQWYSS